MTETVEAGSGRAGRIRFLVFVVSSGLLTLMVAVMLLPNTALELVTAWGGPHMVHDVMFTLFAAMALVGLAAQVGAPRQRVAAMTLVMAFPLGVVVAGAATGFFFPPLAVMLALAAIATVAHPAARDLVRPQARPCVLTLGLALVWLVPAVRYAADNLLLQAGAPVADEHAEFGHWVGAAVIALLVPTLAAVGGLRGRGWRVPAWFAAVAALLLGGVSLAFPGHASSLGVGWGAAAIVWGLALAAVSLFAPIRARAVAADTGRDGAGGADRVTEVET